MGAQSALAAETDETTLTLEGEQDQIEAEPQSSGGGNNVPISVTWLEREYVWGPGDNGVDELLVQYDAGRVPWWVLQDAGGDVVALCDTGGPSGSARVAAQWTYDAYGSVYSADHLLPHAQVRCGHKALFAERLDVGVSDGAGGEPPRLVPFAHVICHNRNRAYNPQLGRFLQADPNEAGLVVIRQLAFNGQASAPGVDNFDLRPRFADGASLYQYLGSNPWESSDPLGLFIDEALDVYITVGATAGVLAAQLTGIYAENLEHDSEWATDWSMPDEWHTRGDASWIQDVYDGLNIYGEVDGYLNPFGGVEFGGPVAGVQQWYRAARALNKIGKVAHHVISFYKTTAKRFKALKDKHKFDFDLWDLKNQLGLDGIDHRGRHRKAYHDRVFKYIEDRLQKGGKDLTGAAAKAAFERALVDLRILIKANPSKWFGP